MGGATTQSKAEPHPRLGSAQGAAGAERAWWRRRLGLRRSRDDRPLGDRELPGLWLELELPRFEGARLRQA